MRQRSSLLFIKPCTQFWSVNLFNQFYYIFSLSFPSINDFYASQSLIQLISIAVHFYSRTSLVRTVIDLLRILPNLILKIGSGSRAPNNQKSDPDLEFQISKDQGGSNNVSNLITNMVPYNLASRYLNVKLNKELKTCFLESQKLNV